MAKTIVEIRSFDPPFINTVSTAATSAIVGWNPISGSIGYNVRYRLSGESTWVDMPMVVPTTTTISGLMPGSNYEFVVQAVCRNNINSEWSDIRPATTTNASSCLPPSEVQVSNITSTSAFVTWNPGISRGVCMIVSYGPESVDPANWTSLLVPFASNSLTLNNLMPGIEYGVSVRTNCTMCTSTSGTRSEPSAPVSFTTSLAKTGANILTELFDVQVYPNPNQGAFNLTVATGSREDLTMEIYDMRGQLVFKTMIAVTGGNFEIPVDITSMASGVYSLQVRQGKFINNLKIQVQ